MVLTQHTVATRLDTTAPILAGRGVWPIGCTLLCMNLRSPSTVVALLCTVVGAGACGSPLAEHTVDVQAHSVAEQAFVVIDDEVALDSARINGVDADTIVPQGADCGVGSRFGLPGYGCLSPSVTAAWNVLPPGTNDLTVAVEVDGQAGEVVVKDHYVVRAFGRETVTAAPGEALQLTWSAPGDTLSDATFTRIPDEFEAPADTEAVDADLTMDADGLATLTPSSPLRVGRWQVFVTSTPAVTCTGFASCTGPSLFAGGQLVEIIDDAT
jgi:hypothetical protein